MSYEFGDQTKIRTILSRNPPVAVHPFTALVGGSNRSGSSALSAMLDGMGIAMDDSYDGHFERLYFKNKLKGKHWVPVMEDVEKLDRHYSDKPWGTQLWLNQSHFTFMLGIVRDPVVILITRDPVGVATRWESVNFQRNNAERVNLAISEMLLTIKIFEEVTCPVIAVSFDRLKTDPGAVFDDLAGFLRFGKENKMEAVARINKGSGYLIQSPPDRMPL